MGTYTRKDSPYIWGGFQHKKKRYAAALSKNARKAQSIYAAWKNRIVSENGDDPELWLNFKERYLVWAESEKNKQTVYRDKLSFSYLEEFKSDIVFLTDISPMLLDEFKAFLKSRSDSLRALYPADKSKKQRRRGLGYHGINRIIQSLKAVLHKAEQWGVLKKEQKWNIVSKIKTPKGRIVYHAPTEIALILDFTYHLAALTKNNYCPWTTVVLLGVRAGLRRGEIQNLKWKNVDFERNIVSITETDDWHPKTYECRDIPLSRDLREHLLNMPRRGEYVVYDAHGERFTLGGLTAYYANKIARKAGLDSFIHKLRHTFASHLVQAGVSLYVVKDLMGHSSITTTEIYAHLAPVTKQYAIELLPDIPISLSQK